MLYGDSDDPVERRRAASRISRKLAMLLAHGLIKKIPRTHRYELTVSGQTTITTLKIVNLIDSFQGRRSSFTHRLKDLHGTLTQDVAESYAWHSIGEAFCEPVTLDDDPRKNLPTQIIAELFKSVGYDGIAYRSSVDGLPPQVVEEDSGTYNVIVFDPSKLVWKQGEVVQITGMKLEIDEGPHY